MASGWFNRGKKEILDGTIDLVAHTMKVMLVTSSYTFSPDDDFVDNGGANDPIDHELTGTGYTAGFGGSGRKTLANKTFSTDDTGDRGEFDADDFTWTGINAGVIRAMIIYRHNTADTDSVMLAYIDNPSAFPLTTNGGDVTITWNAEGILQIT
jgi:hypothetical protein